MANLTLATIGLVLAAPIMGLAAVAVWLTSPGPIIFRQARMGRGGRTFTLYKLRTMHCASGPGVTGGNDKRITFVGRILRKTKVDELPELWNVVKGEMALVGPRPEVPRFVDLNNPSWTAILMTRPGLTDPVTMRLRNEEDVLASVDGDPEEFYVRVLQPLKLQGYLEYLRERSWWSDIVVVWKTGIAVLFPATQGTPNLMELSTRGFGHRN